MSTSLTSLATSRRSSRSATWWPNPISPDLSLEPCASRRQGILRDLLVYMDCLRVLSKIVESGESARAVALERTFTCVFSAEVSNW